MYRRTSAALESGSRVVPAFFLGNGWQRDIERLADYRISLAYDLKPPCGLGGFVAGRSFYIDNFSADDLSRYPFVLVYGVKWHDRDRAERTLEKYVVDGGSLVIDTSANLVSPLSVWNMEDRDFLGFTSMREVRTITPTATPSPPDERRQDELQLRGAVYTGANLRTFLEIGGVPVVSCYESGKGRVYLVGLDLLRNAMTDDGGPLTPYARSALGAILDDTLARTVSVSK